MTHLSASEILAKKLPEALFGMDFSCVKSNFRRLATIWHPDKATGNLEVFQHLNSLLDDADRRHANKKWGCLDVCDFAGGKRFIGQTFIEYEFSSPIAPSAWFANLLRFQSWKFASDAMRDDILRMLPAKIEMPDERHLRVKKSRQTFLNMAHAIGKLEGKDRCRHACWMMSSTFNLCCYLSFVGIVHGDISAENLFIDPADHCVALFGGWQHAMPANAKIATIAKRTFDVLPWDVRVQKVALPGIDLECVKLLGRELLGNDVPDPMKKWLARPSSGKAITDYAEWREVLSESFGKPKFFKLEMSQNDLYGV